MSEMISNQTDICVYTPLSTEERKEHESDYRDEHPAVYCGTYGKYNDGNLSGMWIDLTTFSEFDEFEQFCRRLHSDEPDAELMFQDYENYPAALYEESFMDEDTFDKIISYSENSNQDALDVFLEFYGLDYFDSFDDYYVGEYDSEEDFARCLVEDCYNLESMMGDLSYYFDYEAYARDLFLTDYLFEDGYVFRR